MLTVPSTVSTNFNTATGYFENGASIIAWPHSLVAFSAVGYRDDAAYSAWTTTDTTNQNRVYGGVSLNYDNFGGTWVYWNWDTTFVAAHPTTTVSNGMDAALSGTVLMESGSSIVLGSGSNWARNITVGTAS